MPAVTATSAAAAACGVTCLSVWRCLCEKIRRKAFAKLADRTTGADRRRAAPTSLDLSLNFVPGSYEKDASSTKELKNERGMLTIKNGQNIFWQTWTPARGEVRAAIIVFHGFGDHCDFLNAQKAKVLCGLGPFVAAAFDQPSHGRSDGDLTSIQDWFEHVDMCREVFVEHLRPKLQKQYGEGLKFFGIGESMGGGVLFTMLVRERELFNGAVFICPMLFVSKDLAPPWLVLQVFKHILVPLLPEWPIAPNKDIGPLCFEDPAVYNFLENYKSHHAIVMNTKPRLWTAMQLGFVASEWMQSQLGEFDVPSLLLHGDADVVTDVKVTEALFDKMKNADKEFMRPEGIWHADLFHGGPLKYDGVKERYAKVADWLQKRC